MRRDGVDLIMFCVILLSVAFICCSLVVVFLVIVFVFSLFVNSAIFSLDVWIWYANNYKMFMFFLLFEPCAMTVSWSKILAIFDSCV